MLTASMFVLLVDISALESHIYQKEITAKVTLCYYK